MPDKGEAQGGRGGAEGEGEKVRQKGRGMTGSESMKGWRRDDECLGESEPALPTGAHATIRNMVIATVTSMYVSWTRIR